MRGRNRVPAAFLSAAGRAGRPRSPVEAQPGAYLGTRYSDAVLAGMAEEDGQREFNTPAWGANRELHGELAVLQAGVTHAVAVRQWTDIKIGAVAEAYERAVQKFRAGRTFIEGALVAVAVEEARLAVLRKKLADMGLEPPASTWRVTALLVVLGVGDLTMTSVAMMVLNISDRQFVSWLPFSALQVAAIPVVGGMLAAAHFLGESVKAHRYEPRPHLVIKVAGGAALLGGLSLALSVAQIRTAFLTANGVPALSLPFIGIQLGLFAVAAAASAWAAHPFRAEWRRAARVVRRAGRSYRSARRSAGRLAGRVNRLVRRHRRLVAQGAAGVAAVLSDALRQGYLYRRGHQHGLPEPVTEELHAGPVTQPELPGPVRELLLDYPDKIPTGSNLAPLEPVTLDDLDQARSTLLQQERDEAEAGRRAGERPGPQLGPFPVNGTSGAQRGGRRRAAAKANGTQQPGAR
jgi:hypothetical protein